jgi:hypothetical protein
MARGSLATGPAPDDGYRLAGAASDLVLERSSGGAFPAISAEFAIVAEKFGSASGLDPAKALQAWIAKGGALKVERLAFSTGAVSASATGTLVMAPTGLLSGRLVVRITGLEQLPDIAEELKPGSRDRVARIIGGIGAFTKPVNDGSGAREIDLLVADGAIFAGMFPLPFVIPAVRF